MEKKESLKCPSCGEKVTKNDKYCNSCGKKLIESENEVQSTVRKIKNNFFNGDTVMYLLLIIGVLLFLIGVFYQVPSREFTFSYINKYVGGDAYNAIIESSIRGGEIAGIYALKGALISGGLIIFAIGFTRKNK